VSTAFAVAPDGTRIAYDVTGSGPTLVLLHGGGRNRQTWHEAGYVARLQDSFRVITLDLRGHGESDKPTDPAAYSTERMGADILAVADACGADRFAVWGFSYGGNIGRYLAVRSPRVSRMVIMGIPFGEGAQGAFRQQILDLRARWGPILAAQEAGTLDPTTLAPDEQAALERGGMPVLLAWLGGILDWPALVPADMPCPTLWLVGGDNSGALESVGAYEASLPGSQVQVQIVPGLTHAQEFSEIDRVLPVMRAFTEAA
jgi:pimeloyl-ACP methyl ester carboxylesterase